MPRLEVIRNDRPPMWRRVVDNIRSSWSGPLTSRSPELAKLYGATPTSTGIAVTEQTALNLSAVWAAVSIISADVASLPLILYKRLPSGGKERLVNHPLFRLLHDEPNSEMTSMVFRETLQAHILTWGNGYAEIERDGATRPVALWPLTPNRVEPYRDPRTQQIRYRVSREGGNTADHFDANDILHIPGLGFDGLVGYSVIAHARESIGLGLAAERFGGTFFGNGATFGGVFEHPTKMSDKAKRNFQESLAARHAGVDRAHKFLVVEEGMKYARTGIPPDDAQFLETRQFQIPEIARWFTMPPHKLGDLSRATFSNIEHQDIDYYKSCLRKWLVRWEQELKRKLISRAERNIQLVEHLLEGFLRGDLASRNAAYAVGRQWGWLSADDVLELENRNPLPNGQGKIYLVPANMWPADKMPDPTKALQAPRPEPEPAPAEDDEPARALRAMEEEARTAREAEEQARRDAQTEREARAKAEGQVETTAADLTASREREQALLAKADEAGRAAASLETKLAILTELSEARKAEVERMAQERAAETQQAAARMGAIVAANRALIVDAMGRMVRRETEKARRNQATAEKLRHWSQSFYVIHEQTCCDALLPAVRAHLAVLGSTDDPSVVTQSIVQAHISESVRQLEAVAASEPDEYRVELEKMLIRWETQRAEALADRLLTEELDRVRAH